MSRTGDSHYIHGCDPEEQQRLSRLNSYLNASSLRELNIRDERRILDVGCGLGQFTRLMAGAAPGSVVIGVERDERQISEARRLAAREKQERLCDLRAGRAEELPLTSEEWGSFDLAHARFVLEHVADPLQVVRQMARAVRPGGRVVLEDEDHDLLRLYPELPGIGPVWIAYIQSYERLGNDPFVGRRLVWLLHQAGLRPVRNTAIFFGSCAGQDSFPLLVENFLGILRGAREVILDHRLIEPGRFDRGLEEFHAWGARPDAAIWFCMSWAEGRKSAGQAGV